MSVFVAYFTASVAGVTEKLAKRIASLTGGTLYQIKPETPYTKADLDWTTKASRSSVEMADKDCRPALADNDAPVADADVVYIGYPVWWYREPSIIDTFAAAYDFSGKKIVLFATSGSSDIGTEAGERIEAITGVKVSGAKRFAASVSDEQLKAWAQF